MQDVEPGETWWQQEARAGDHVCVLAGEDRQEPRHTVWVLHPWDGDVHVYPAQEPPPALRGAAHGSPGR